MNDPLAPRLKVKPPIFEPEFVRVNALFAMTVAPAPAPLMVSALFKIWMLLDHVAEPALTVIVAPSAALFTQVVILDWSGVLDQLRLDPVHAACAGTAHQGATLTRAAIASFTSRFRSVDTGVMSVAPSCGRFQAVRA